MEGIYFIASGEKYVNEALRAINRVKQIMPQIPVALCTNENVNGAMDYIIPLKNPLYNFCDKVLNYVNTPFDKTIFLDTDVFVLSDISNLFLLLDRFDIAAPHAPIEEDILVKLPDCFPEPNSGVVAYKKSEAVLNMFSMYSEHYKDALNYYMVTENDIPPDQPSFRYAIFHSDVNFTFLPHEYNCMVDFPCFLSGKVRILHGHYDEKKMSEIANSVNDKEGIRIYIPNGI